KQRNDLATLTLIPQMTIRQLLRQHPRYLSFGFLHYFFSAAGQTFFISLFVAAMTERMGWAEGTFAGLYSGVTLVAAFTLPVIGAQVDRLRVRYVSTVTALLLILGCITLGLTTNFYLLAVALFVVRLGGQGVLPLIGSTTIGRYFTSGRGKALSASIIGISVAEVMLPPGVVLLLQELGYATVWLIAAGVLAVVFIPSVWLLIRRYDNFQRADTVAAEQAAASPEVAEQFSWTRGQVLRDRRFWLLFPAFIFIPFLFTGLVFNQAVLAADRGYTAAWMAVGLSTYGFVRVLLLLSAGSVTDRYGAARLLRFVYVPVLLGLVGLLLLRGQVAVPLFFGLMGVTAGVESVLWPALWAERYGPRFLGSIKSTVRFLVVLASSAAPVAFSFGFRLGVETWLGLILGYGLLAFVLVCLEFGARPRVPS
ncbi:MAG: MFS transporter, partial [Bacteroidota bacterium]